MKFIVDAQLPKALSDALCALGHDSVHTLQLSGRNETPDTLIVSMAAEENRIVISKDSDFLQSHIIKGEPKKLVLIKTGKISNIELRSIFEKQIELICNSLIQNNLVVIYKTGIVVN